MPQHIFIGLAGGLASAVLFASAILGGPGGAFLLYTLAPLPSLLAGLGWGAIAAAVAAIAGSVGLGIGLGSAKLALAFFLTQGVPIVIICHLLMLNRPLAAGPSDIGTQAPTVEWYPVGRLLAVAAVIGGCIATATLLTLGTDAEVIRQQLQDVITKVFSKDIERLNGKPMSADEISALARLTLFVLPAASATSWLATFMLNLWLAGRITQASGRLARPWPDLATTLLPRGLAIALAAALAVTFVSGYPGLVASGFAGSFLFAYMLVGLAIIHYVTRGKPQRALILGGVYVGLVIFNIWAAMALAVLALLEPISPLKRWPSNPSSGG